MDMDISTFDEAAIITHEMFVAYLRAGFTGDQAMTLVLHHLSMGSHINEQREADGHADP